LKVTLGFKSHMRSNVYFGRCDSGGHVFVAVYSDNVAWNGATASRRWFEKQFFKLCNGTTSYE